MGRPEKETGHIDKTEGNGKYKTKRTNGSKRAQKNKRERIQRWEKSGISIGSQNVAGISLLKVYMLLGTHTLDVLCL
jgi:hypothetical protein